MPEEIDHTVYASNSNYENAVAGHIAKILNLQDMASKCNEENIQKSENISIGNMLRNRECIHSQ